MILDLHTLAWSRPLTDGHFSIAMHGSIPLDAGKVLNLGGMTLYGGKNGVHQNRHAATMFDVHSESFLTNVVEVCGTCDTFTELQCKFILIGSHGSGRTSIIRRFVEDRFLTTSTPLGSTHRTVLTLIQGKLVKIHLYDLHHDASLKEVDTLGRDADGIILVYDQTDETSLDNLETWSLQIRAAAVGGDRDTIPMMLGATSPTRSPASAASSVGSPQPLSPLSPPLSATSPSSAPASSSSSSKAHLLLLGNKCDRPKSPRSVSTPSLRALLSRLGDDCQHVETSARLGTNIDTAFLTLAQTIVGERIDGKKRHNNRCTIC